MIKVGLTGNIGSGKSTVCQVFESLDVPVYYSDIEAKKLYSREEVKNKLMLRFGKPVFNDLGEVDFKKLASLIFNHKDSLDFINNLIHPLVFESYNNWLSEHAESRYTIHESAILFEHHLEKRFDKTIVVYCPQDIRLRRVTARDGVSEEEVLKRMSNQMEDSLKNKLADFLIVNDGVKMVIPQVTKINKIMGH